MDISSKYKIVENDFWDDLPDEVKEGINQAKDQLQKGQGTPHSNVIADVKAIFLNKQFDLLG